MSGTATEFTAAAAARLDDYLSQVRAALAASPDLDPADIEADIREHVAVEFRSHTRPVSLVELERVLAALGPPAGWAPVPTGRPTPALSPWAAVAGVKRWVLGTIGVLWRGPEDWRLAYLCLLFTVLGVASMGILLPVAYLLARAAVALAAEKNQPLGPRAWLVYPPVVLVALPLLLAVCLWPVLLAPLTYNAAVDPAERFREEVAEVRSDYTVVLVREPEAVRDRSGRVVDYRQRMPLIWAGIRWSDNAWRISPADLRAHTLTLRALDRMPAPPGYRGVPLSLFVAAGGLLAWGLVAGLVGWQFPRTVAAVFFPLLSGDGRGAARLAVGCGAGFIVWAGFAARLLDAGAVWA
jgi:hypothetical protein